MSIQRMKNKAVMMGNYIRANYNNIGQEELTALQIYRTGMLMQQLRLRKLTNIKPEIVSAAEIPEINKPDLEIINSPKYSQEEKAYRLHLLGNTKEQIQQLMLMTAPQVYKSIWRFTAGNKKLTD